MSCYSRSVYMRRGTLWFTAHDRIWKGQLLSFCITLSLALACTWPIGFGNPSVSRWGYFHILLVMCSNNSYCLCHQIQMHQLQASLLLIQCCHWAMPCMVWSNAVILRCLWASWLKLSVNWSNFTLIKGFLAPFLQQKRRMGTVQQ